MDARIILKQRTCTNVDPGPIMSNSCKRIAHNQCRHKEMNNHPTDIFWKFHGRSEGFNSESIDLLQLVAHYLVRLSRRDLNFFIIIIPNYSLF